MQDYEKAIFRAALSKYGITNQKIVAIEECAELIKALCKSLRGFADLNNIAEEMADVSIMLDQMSIVFQNSDLVRSHRNKKVVRLKARIGKGVDQHGNPNAN